MGLHGRRAGFDRFAEDRLTPHQFAAHAPPLRALAAHDKTDPRRMLRTRCERRANHVSRRFRRKTTQFLNQFVRRMRYHRQPVRVVIATGTERVTQRRKKRRFPIVLRVILNPVSHPGCNVLQCVFRAGRQYQRPAAIRRSGLSGDRCLRWSFSYNDVRIGSAETKRVDANDALVARFRKRLHFGGHPQFQCGEVDMSARCLEMQARRNLPIFEDEQCLDEAHHSGSRFQVTQIGFHRTNGERDIGWPVSAERIRECSGLDWVTHGGSCAVCLHVSDLRWIDTSINAGVTYETGLCIRTWKRNAIGMAILIQGGTQNHAMNRITIRNGLRERL